jgi:hypothetical protein
LTIPTVFRTAPYVHFERNADSAIRHLLQAREGDPMPPAGESDAGLFCFQTNVLRHLLAALKSKPEGWGRKTAEFNLLAGAEPRSRGNPGTFAVRAHGTRGR